MVGADSATAAIMAAGLAGMAPIASPQYVQLAGMLAIITGGILILARLVKLGFIADFLSRSVLIGFLTGVGIQVAMGHIVGADSATAAHFITDPVAAGLSTEPGLVIFRCAASLYYANANRFNEEILELVGDGAPDVRWLVVEAGAMADIDYSGGETVKQVINELQARGVHFAMADIAPGVLALLDRYGITELAGEDAYYDTAAAATEAFRASASA